jgi:GntR family transcriptional regulator, vanillate catabolism transcriptional regulator
MSLPTAFTTKSGLAHQQIKQMILSGEVKPGDRIKMAELSRKLGISETPIREAILALTAEGWLDMTTHVGAVVRTINVEQVHEISSIRGLISGLALELNGPRFDAALLQKLRENVETMDAAVQRGDLQGFATFNDEFHRLIYRDHVSPWCARIIEGMLGLLSHQRHGIAPNVERLQDSVREHRKMLEYLCEGDFRAAADMAKLHERNAGLFLIRELKKTKSKASDA